MKMDSNSVQSLAELLEKVSLNTFEPGSSYWVEVTHIDDPHNFYVLPTSYKNSMINIEGEGEEIDPDYLHVGTLVTFSSKNLNKYIRGHITAVVPRKQKFTYTLFALDYGFTEEHVNKKYIRKANCFIPPLAVHCKLADCKPTNASNGATFTKEAIDAMKFYVDNKSVPKELKMHVREKRAQHLVVELINTANIAMLLALTGYTTLGYDENTVNRFSNGQVIEKPNFTYLYEQFEPHDIVKVRVQSGKTGDEFYVAELNNYQKYLGEKDGFTYYCKRFADNLQVGDLEIYKPVALLTPMKYERALIKEILGRKVQVQMVDWGKIQEVNFDYLKIIDREYFLHYPVAAIYCRAENVTPSDLLVGREFSIQIKEVGDGFSKPHLVVKV